MEKGSYKGRRVDFSKYAAYFFNPYLWAHSVHAQFGCGATALALITGITPGEIAATNKRAPHYPDRFMRQVLKENGFSSVGLTLCNLSTGRSCIGNNHVVLLSQLFRKNEGTWGVIYREMYYHNFEIYHLDGLSMLNKPILSAYLVSHPKWRNLRTNMTQ